MPTTVVLNGHTYSSTQFPGYGYLAPHPDTGLQIFPDSIFTDMIAQIASDTAAIAALNGLTPGSAGNLIISDGTSWVRSSGSGVAGKLDALAVGGTVVTVSTPLIVATQTWNAGAVVFTGVKVNVTDTASASSSLFFDFQLASSSMVNANKAGLVSSVGGFLTTGQAISHTASKAAFTFAAGNSQMWSWGASPTVIGGFAWISRSSDGSLGDTIMTLSGTGKLGFGSTFSAIAAQGTAATGSKIDFYSTTPDSYRIGLGTTGNIWYQASQHHFYIASTLTFAMNAAGVVVGTDPGGTDLLRIGGTVFAGGVATANITASGSNSGNLFIVNTGANARSWRIQNSTSVGAGAFVIQDSTAGLNRLVIDTTGIVTLSVGAIVGTDPGGAALVRVGGNLQYNGNLFGGSAGAGIWFNSTGAFTVGLFESSGTLHFRTGGSDKFVLDGNGLLTTIGAASGVNVNSIFGLKAGSASISTTAATIYTTVGSTGVFAHVTGFSGGAQGFADLVVMYAGGAPPVVASSNTTVNAPGARTYTMSGRNLQLSVAGGATYTVAVMAFDA
jgi:hypothetical protein